MFDAGVNRRSPLREYSTRPSFIEITKTPQRARVRSLASIARSISCASVVSSGCFEALALSGALAGGAGAAGLFAFSFDSKPDRAIRSEARKRVVSTTDESANFVIFVL